MVGLDNDGGEDGEDVAVAALAVHGGVLQGDGSECNRVMARGSRSVQIFLLPTVSYRHARHSSTCSRVMAGNIWPLCPLLATGMSCTRCGRRV